jgi:TRAP-type C4-dicarboxylate transport system permease small subunit
MEVGCFESRLSRTELMLGPARSQDGRLVLLSGVNSAEPADRKSRWGDSSGEWMKKLYEYLCLGELFLVKVAFFSLVLLVFIAAFTRYIGYPINWSVDMAQCLFAWCTFIAADIALRNNKLMKVDFFVAKLPERYRNKIELLNLIIILAFLLALIGYGSYLSYTTRFRTFQGIPGFSYTWVTLSVPVGSLLMSITTALNIRAILREIRAVSAA